MTSEAFIAVTSTYSTVLQSPDNISIHNLSPKDILLHDDRLTLNVVGSQESSWQALIIDPMTSTISLVWTSASWDLAIFKIFKFMFKCKTMDSKSLDFFYLYNTTTRSVTLNVLEIYFAVYCALPTPPWGVKVLIILRKAPSQWEVR